MNWNELYSEIMPNVDFWANYLSTRTALEKEDCSQQLLLAAWEIYCKKEGAVNKPFIQYMLKYASNRIFYLYFKDSETKLNALSIEVVEEEEILHRDVEYYLESDYIRMEFIDIIEKEYAGFLKQSYYLNVLESLLKGKKTEEIAKEVNNTYNSVKYTINSKIKPVIAKRY